jgi:protein-S-isoprenylcysteine O-methyltransferase Ste14
VYAVAGLLAQRALAPDERSAPARRVAGWAIAAGAFGLMASANVAFRRHRTTVNPIDPGKASSLVTDGPFRLTRNPMYVGMAGVLAGHAVGRGGWLTPLPVAAFVAVIDRSQIPAEEAAMTRLFGEAYDAYRSRVPRWVGLSV